MTLHQLRIFLAVSKHLSVTRAALELHITQPAVSRQLKQLSEECGTTLYRVTARGIELTRKGKLLAAGAEQLAAHWEALKGSLQDSQAPATLKIGESESLSLSLIPALLSTFRRISPGVQLVIRTDSSPALERMLLDSEIELALLANRSFHPSLSYEPFRQERLVFFVPAKHPLAKKSKVTAMDLSAVPLVVVKGRSGGGSASEAVLARLEENGIKINVAVCCDSAWAVKNAVDSGLGVGILHQDMVAPDVKRGDVRIVRMTDAPEIESYIVFHREKLCSSYARTFLDLLRQWPKTGCGPKQLKVG